MKRFKIVLLFLFVLCAFSFCVFYVRSIYITRKENDALRGAKDFLECFDTDVEQECAIYGNGAIGIIKIQRLGIEAPIFEGTDSEILKFSVRSFF